MDQSSEYKHNTYQEYFKVTFFLCKIKISLLKSRKNANLSRVNEMTLLKWKAW